MLGLYKNQRSIPIWMSPFTPGSGPVRSSSVCSGIFVSEEGDGVGDKGVGRYHTS